MKKSLTIEDLKSRIGKPVFVVCLLYNCKEWRILRNIGFGGVNTLEFTDDSEVSEEIQDKFRFFDEEVTFQEIKKILESEEKLKKKTGYETVDESKSYFYINEELEISEEHAYINGNCIDSKRSENGNHFNDETLTINLARAEALKYKLRRFAALNGGIPSKKDWKNKYFNKYYIKYYYEDNKLDFSNANFFKDFGQIYFKSKYACEKAIEIFEDELIWYFTEFEEQLY